MRDFANMRYAPDQGMRARIKAYSTGAHKQLRPSAMRSRDRSRAQFGASLALTPWVRLPI